MRAQALKLSQRVLSHTLALPNVIAKAKDPAKPCVMCGDKLKVRKSFKHKGQTIEHGVFKVRETIWECASGCCYPNGQKVTERAEVVANTLLPGRTVGYDLMTFIGLKRFIENEQREEICLTLRKDHGVEISTGEVSNLNQLFVQYVNRLHRANGPLLKEALISDGGWPMQVDATGEHGQGTLFVVMAGWRQWVLGAWKPSTEKAELLLPCLRETVRRFGAPCAVMRDMGRAITPAIETLLEEFSLQIPVLTCHQHFLADVGKDLLKDLHTELRELFKRHKVRPKLRELVRELGGKLDKSTHHNHKAVRDWQSAANAGHQVPSGSDGLAVVRAIGQWTLDYKADATGLDFPFDRPYLDFYDRCSAALRATDAFFCSAPTDKDVTRALKKLHRRLAPVSSDVPFAQITRQLRHRAALFDEMRDVLRLAAEPPQEQTMQQLDALRQNFENWTTKLKNRRPSRGPAKQIRLGIDIILTHIEKHGKNLWGHAILLPSDSGKNIRLVSRTNFLLENWFKHLKHGERRRSGHRILSQDLEVLPAEAAFVYNLKRDDYIRIVCGSIDQLPKAFAKLDRDDRHRKQMLKTDKSEKNADEDLKALLMTATASLPTADRRVVRSDAMTKKIKTAAKSRAPRLAI